MLLKIRCPTHTIIGENVGLNCMETIPCDVHTRSTRTQPSIDLHQTTACQTATTLHAASVSKRSCRAQKNAPHPRSMSAYSAWARFRARIVPSASRSRPHAHATSRVPMPTQISSFSHRARPPPLDLPMSSSFSVALRAPPPRRLPTPESVLISEFQ